MTVTHHINRGQITLHRPRLIVQFIRGSLITKEHLTNCFFPAAQENDELSPQMAAATKCHDQPEEEITASQPIKSSSCSAAPDSSKFSPEFRRATAGEKEASKAGAIDAAAFVVMLTSSGAFFAWEDRLFYRA